MTTSIPIPSASKDWHIPSEDEPRSPCLLILLRDRVVVLPWYGFRYAEFAPSVARIQFSTHTVVIEGRGFLSGPDGLIQGISTQRLARIAQPSENEIRFQVGPGITSITVTEVGEEDDAG